MPHLTPSVGLYVHYDHAPLQVIDRDTQESVYDEVRFQFSASLMAAFGLYDRVELGVALPFVMAQGTGGRGPGFPPEPSLGGALGDLRIVPKLRLVTVGPFTASIAAAIDLPTGDMDNYLGDDGVGFQPRAIFSLDWRDLSVAFNGSFRLRPDHTFLRQTPPRITVANEVLLSLGARLTLHRNIDLIVDGDSVFNVGEQNPSKISGELLGGLRFHLPLGFLVNVGAGPGIGQGVGTPAARVLVGVHWMPAKSAPVDGDGDGLLPPGDKCPDEPEDKDGFKDDDGCPDLDNDNDGIADTDDKCPNIAEDKDGFEDDDGCPDLDNDSDGVLDTEDRCPNKPEDHDGFEDDDGCPEADNDGDRIMDADDRCPNKPETFNGVDDDDGCPDLGKGPVQLVHGKITVPPVFFATNKDRILGKSFPTLQLVAKVLTDNPWIKKVIVEGHTDDRGDDDFNLDLSRRRAASVTRFLIKEGIDSKRLQPEGYGEMHPVTTNSTREGRAKNRRVEFAIVDPPQAKPRPATPTKPATESNRPGE